MNCECFEIIAKRLIGEDRKGKKIVQSEFKQYDWIYEENGAVARTSFDFDVVFESGKNGKMPVIHNFCPYCGKSQRSNHHYRYRHGRDMPCCPNCENPYPHNHTDGSFSCEECGNEWEI
jgi:ribosomal protein L37AE/L43A